LHYWHSSSTDEQALSNLQGPLGSVLSTAVLGVRSWEGAGIPYYWLTGRSLVSRESGL